LRLTVSRRRTRVLRARTPLEAVEKVVR
jgi:hypothetical protein